MRIACERVPICVKHGGTGHPISVLHNRRPQLRLETLGSTGARSVGEVPDSTRVFSDLGQVLKQKLFGASAKSNDPERLDNTDFAPEEIEMEREIRGQSLARLATLAPPLDHVRKMSIGHPKLDESSIQQHAAWVRFGPRIR